jgi:hypothetical protein
MKRTLKFGIDACFGMLRVLDTFDPPTLRDRRIASDIYRLIELNEERRKEINFHIMSREEKIEKGFPLDQEGNTWDAVIPEDHWEVEMSDSEWDVLKLAMKSFKQWKRRDDWERFINTQLDNELVPVTKQ